MMVNDIPDYIVPKVKYCSWCENKKKHKSTNVSLGL